MIFGWPTGPLTADLEYNGSTFLIKVEYVRGTGNTYLRIRPYNINHIYVRTLQCGIAAKHNHQANHSKTNRRNISVIFPRKLLCASVIYVRTYKDIDSMFVLRTYTLYVGRSVFLRGINLTRLVILVHSIWRVFFIIFLAISYIMQLVEMSFLCECNSSACFTHSI